MKNHGTRRPGLIGTSDHHLQSRLRAFYALQGVLSNRTEANSILWEQNTI